MIGRTNADNSGGLDIDSLTAKPEDVLAGKKFGGAGSDEPLTGALTLSGNASDGQVLSGSTYYNTDVKEKRTGSMPNYSGKQIYTSDTTAITKYETGGNNTTGYYGYISHDFHSSDGDKSGYFDKGSTVRQWVYGLHPDVIKYGQRIGKNSADTSTYATGNFTGDATATAGDILNGKSAYVKGNKITGNMANRGAVNQTLGINGSYTIPAGYHNGSGKVTQNIATQGGSTTTPGTTNKTVVNANRYVTGNIIVKGDSNLKPENIARGVTIFGVTGTAYVRAQLPGSWYSPDNEYLDITGGFKYGTTTTATGEKRSTGLYIKTGYTRNEEMYGSYITKKLINITNIRNIKVKATVIDYSYDRRDTTGSDGYGRMGIFLTTNASTTCSRTTQYAVNSATGSTISFTYDVSNQSGNYYIGCTVLAGGRGLSYLAMLITNITYDTL